MNPYDTAMAIMKAIGDIFKFIGKTFSFTCSLISKIWNVFIDFIRNICTSIGIMGLSNIFLKISLSGLVGVMVLSVLSLIPDFITYFGCRLSKNYRKLNTKEEKSEYTSKHTHFLLKLILSIHNNSLRKRAEKVAKKAAKIEKKRVKKEEKISKKQLKIVKEKEKTENIIDGAIDEVLNQEFVYDVPVDEDIEVIVNDKEIDASPVVENNLLAPCLPQTDSFEQVSNSKDIIADINESIMEIQEQQTKSNIKILYSSDIVGKMLRKGVVLDRRMGKENYPVLIDFTNKPTEFFTGHLCDDESGIKVKKYINGELVEYILDNSSILEDAKIIESINDKETLESLRVKLQNDARYQKNMKNFFNIHDKAMVKVKELKDNKI